MRRENGQAQDPCDGVHHLPARRSEPLDKELHEDMRLVQRDLRQAEPNHYGQAEAYHFVCA